MEIKDTTFTTILNAGAEHITVFRVKLDTYLNLPKLNTANAETLKDLEKHPYVEKAKAMLDDLSEDYNPQGIEAILAALIITVQDLGYNGKKNL